MRKKLIIISAILGFVLNFYNTSLAGYTVSPGKFQKYESQNFLLKPTEKATGYITLYNLDKENSISLSLYTADATKTQTGELTLKNKNEIQNGVSKWISPSLNNIDLNAGEYKEIPFDLTVPENTPPGTYIGGLSIETTNTRQPQNEKSNGAISLTRIITMIYIEVPGDKNSSYKLGNFNFKDNKFNYYIENNGNTILKLSGYIEVQETKEKFQVNSLIEFGEKLDLNIP